MSDRASIHEVKARLSYYLRRVEEGEVIVICRHNVPIAELRSIKGSSGKGLNLGVARGEVQVSDAFFERLPDDLLDEGKSG
jgi:prevent-host-death family protein